MMSSGMYTTLRQSCKADKKQTAWGRVHFPCSSFSSFSFFSFFFFEVGITQKDDSLNPKEVTMPARASYAALHKDPEWQHQASSSMHFPAGRMCICVATYTIIISPERQFLPNDRLNSGLSARLMLPVQLTC